MWESDLSSCKDLNCSLMSGSDLIQSCPNVCALQAALKAAKDALAVETAAAAGLRKELGGRPAASEVRALRQQLRMLQQLEFNAGDDDGVSGGELMVLLLLVLDWPGLGGLCFRSVVFVWYGTVCFGIV